MTSAAIREVPDQYEHCRVWNHEWRFTTVDLEGNVFFQGMKCRNCGTIRKVKISRVDGQRVNKYRYPEDQDKEAVPYKMPKDSGGALTAEERGYALIHNVEARYEAQKARQERRRKPQAGF